MKTRILFLTMIFTPAFCLAAAEGAPAARPDAEPVTVSLEQLKLSSGQDSQKSVALAVPEPTLVAVEPVLRSKKRSRAGTSGAGLKAAAGYGAKSLSSRIQINTIMDMPGTILITLMNYSDQAAYEATLGLIAEGYSADYWTLDLCGNASCNMAYILVSIPEIYVPETALKFLDYPFVSELFISESAYNILNAMR